MAVSLDRACEGMATIALEVGARAALAYFRQHSPAHYEDPRLAEVLRRHLKATMPQALEDAKEAFACGMDRVAEATFRASMGQAGIAAAKEICGQ